MQLTYLVATTLATAASATVFNHFENKSCQQWNGTYVPLTAAEQQAIVAETYAGSASTPEASGVWASPQAKARCPSNVDDTYKWISIPQWQQTPAGQRGGGGAIAVVYYNTTDTYNACAYLASSQFGGYVGSCSSF